MHIYGREVERVPHPGFSQPSTVSFTQILRKKFALQSKYLEFIRGLEWPKRILGLLLRKDNREGKGDSLTVEIALQV